MCRAPTWRSTTRCCPEGCSDDGAEHPGDDVADAVRLPAPVVQQLETLATGAFLETATNVLAFGLPGVGKSHALCAVGHALVEAGHSVLCAPAYGLVQELLGAKRDLDLPRALRKLDLFEVILLDDLGYVQQSPDEAEVLFTLLAERYERRSVMVTSNLVFSQWDRIFRDQMATAAAIDRLVHHAVVLEFDVTSYRTDRSRRKTPPSPAPRGRAPGAAVAPDPSPVDLLNARPVRDPRGLWMVPAAWKTRAGSGASVRRPVSAFSTPLWTAHAPSTPPTGSMLLLIQTQGIRTGQNNCRQAAKVVDAEHRGFL